MFKVQALFHYLGVQITWERSLPYGCKAWGVRAHQYPDTLVHGASGMACQLFELKPLKSDSIYQVSAT